MNHIQVNIVSQDQDDKVPLKRRLRSRSKTPMKSKISIDYKVQAQVKNKKPNGSKGNANDNSIIKRKVRAKSKSNSELSKSMSMSNSHDRKQNRLIKDGRKVIETILDKRKKGIEDFEYLIKRKGYSEDESTWEPLKNILPASLVAEYEGRKALERQEAFLCGSQK